MSSSLTARWPTWATSCGRPSTPNRSISRTASCASSRRCIVGDRIAFGALASEAPRDRAGYALARSANESGIHLGRLVAGSEGTLGLVTQAMLRTVPTPAAQAVVLLPFQGLSYAAAFVPQVLDSTLAPSSCDLLDRRSLRLARDADPLFRQAIDESAESILLVEFEGGDLAEVFEKVNLVRERATRTGRLAAEVSVHAKRADCERIVSWRRIVESLLMRFRGPARPVSIFDDIAVPPDRLGLVLQRLQALLQHQNLTWALDAYAGEGRLRIRPFLDLSNPDDRQALEPLTARVYEIVLDSRGTISSSQACGLLRTQFLRNQYGDVVQVFREIKDAFDPLSQLNPGKVIGDDPHLMVQNLRMLPRLESPGDAEAPSTAVPSPASVREESSIELGHTPDESASSSDQPISLLSSAVQPVLIWPKLQMLEMANACHGCGACRTLDPASECAPASGPCVMKRPRRGRRPT